MKNKLFRKWDFIIIAAVLIAAFSGIYIERSSGDTDELTAVITVDGEVYKKINLASVKERKEIKPETDPEVIIVAENGCIYFESAGCSDKICVSAGKLSKKGDTAVCLPAKTVVSITGASMPDAVTW